MVVNGLTKKSNLFSRYGHDKDGQTRLFSDECSLPRVEKELLKWLSMVKTIIHGGYSNDKGGF